MTGYSAIHIIIHKRLKRVLNNISFNSNDMMGQNIKKHKVLTDDGYIIVDNFQEARTCANISSGSTKKPIIISFYNAPDNSEYTLYKEWQLDGKFHRTDGPAKEWFFTNGKPKKHEWYINDQKHRECGPAMIIFDAHGNAVNEEWWFNGTQYSEDSWVVVKIKNKMSII